MEIDRDITQIVIYNSACGLSKCTTKFLKQNSKYITDLMPQTWKYLTNLMISCSKGLELVILASIFVCDLHQVISEWTVCAICASYI